MPVAYNKYTTGIGAMLEGMNCGTDTWKFALASTVTSSDTTFTPGTTDLATGGGYTQGGTAVTISSHSAAGGTYKLVLTAPSTWTASGAGFSFRYVILWDSTTSTPIGYWDYGSTLTLNGSSGDTFTFTPDGTNGVFQVS